MSHDGSDSFRLGQGGRLGVIALACWALLCAAWNLCGAIQIAHGLATSWAGYNASGSGLLARPGCHSDAGSRRGTILVLVPAVLSAGLAGLTVWNAFSLRLALWPSEFWRFVAVALNALGIGGTILVLVEAAHRQFAAPGRS